jgi:hypothetical protein
MLSTTQRQITYVLLTRAPLYRGRSPFSLDLHVLSAPLTFVLSQDQTLQLNPVGGLGYRCIAACYGIDARLTRSPIFSLIGYEPVCRMGILLTTCEGEKFALRVTRLDRDPRCLSRE